MIISRTPFRVSFFGGGTDYPVWYQDHGGAVIGTSIDKYCYITCRYLPPFFEHKSRIVYSQVEMVKDPQEIKHPAVRAALKCLSIDRGVEIHHDGDLPARGGLGSSSSFAVGLLHTLYMLKGIMPTKQQLALDATHLERDILHENVGSQDQALAAHGGFNLVEFSGQDGIRVQPIAISPERLEALQDHLMLFFTGLVRNASEIAADQIRETPNRVQELKAMHQMVYQALDVIAGADDIADFGKLLHESWMLKRGLTKAVSTPLVDEIYDCALATGATGGKLLGAGGGGFLLLFARPELHCAIKEKLRGLLHVPFQFERLGSQIIFYDP